MSRILLAFFAFLLIGFGSKAKAACNDESYQAVTGTFVSGRGGHRVTGLIVFVHGLGGGVSTWTNEQTKTTWPKIVAADDLFSVNDIYVVQYGSQITGRSLSTDEMAACLGRHLDEAVGVASYQQIFFVAHSWGGIIVRRMTLDKPDWYQKIKAHFFFGVPSQGSQLASAMAALGLASQATNDLQMQNKYGTYLDKLSESWIGWPPAKVINIYCAYETKGVSVRFIGLVVKPKSARERCDSAFEKIEEDHFAIVKPGSELARSHQLLRTWYRKEMPGVNENDTRTPVMFVTCPVDRYGADFRAALDSEVRSMGHAIRLSRKMPNDWKSYYDPSPNIWPVYQPRVLIMHFSCFREGENIYGEKEDVRRTKDFDAFIASLKNSKTKVLAYSYSIRHGLEFLTPYPAISAAMKSGQLRIIEIDPNIVNEKKIRANFRAEVKSMLEGVSNVKQKPKPAG